MTGPAALALALLVFVLFFRQIASKKYRRLPPGPKPLPVLGNLLSLPKERPWVTYQTWSDRYGSNILYISVTGHPAIIINSVKDAYNLLEKRSRNTSDREHTVAERMIGWDYALSLMPYGSRWRNVRRTFHQYFNSVVVKSYRPIQAREIRSFLKRALGLSECIHLPIISQTFAATIMDIVYGIQVTSVEDEYVSVSRKAIEAISSGKLFGGGFWADYFPWLMPIQYWLPGSSIRKFVEFYKPYVEASREKAFNTVLRNMRDGTARPSVVKTFLEKMQSDSSIPEHYSKSDNMKDAAGMAYVAAADTQMSSITSFILAMAVNPSVQRKAQTELDAVVGKERLPTIEDIHEIPYIQALVLEMMRWMPVVPLGLPHRVIEDDEYKGYDIPAGCDIIPNAWAMLHNPVEYPDPESFNPDRFLRDGQINPDVLDPTTIAFGFGRRVCAGKHFAIDMLSLMAASILHVFNIEPNTDQPITPTCTTGLLSFPEHLPCCFKPRDSNSLKLILSVGDD